MLFKNIQGETFFEKPLEEARIVSRPNRFIMEVEHPEKGLVRAHCPTTGLIGHARLDNLPCLLSGPYQGNRATEYTVEALAFYEQNDERFQWIGINQSVINHFVFNAMEANLLTAHPLLHFPAEVKKEPRLGARRLDFLVNGQLYLEVKMPLKHLQTSIPPERLAVMQSATQVDRMVAQVEEITQALHQGQRAMLLTAFVYDNPGFKTPTKHAKAYSRVREVLATARQAGLENWQINFTISPEKAKMTRFEKLY